MRGVLHPLTVLAGLTAPLHLYSSRRSPIWLGRPRPRRPVQWKPHPADVPTPRRADKNLRNSLKPYGINWK